MHALQLLALGQTAMDCRGFRAPEAVAAALAKRAYVRSVPFLVGRGEQTAAVLHRQDCRTLGLMLKHKVMGSMRPYLWAVMLGMIRDWSACLAQSLAH